MSLFRNASVCCVALIGAACGQSDNNLYWWVAQGKVSAPYPAIEGANVCVDAQPGIACATTDAHGAFTLHDLPDSTELVLTIEKDGYLPSLKPITTASSTSQVVQPIVMVKAADLPTNLGFDIDTTTLGMVDFFAIVLAEDGVRDPGPLSGVKVALSAANDTSPVYFKEPGVLDPALQATASYSGTFGSGNVTSGRFFNVPPGDYTVTFTPPAGYTCSSLTSPLAAWGFPIPGESAVRVVVRAGHNTANVGVHCKR